MEPESFLKTIYLGDRACKGVFIDSWDKKLRLLVDTISRVRDVSGQWNHYTDEDIEEGYLVLEGLRELRFEPPGPVPNDFINGIDVRKVESNAAVYEFSVSVSSVDDEGNSQEILITAVAAGCYLEDPKRPGERIL